MSITIKYRRDLYQLLPDVKNSVCAELGVAEGYFSGEMLAWGIKTLYMVDAWECLPHLTGDGSSPQAWHNHNYEATLKRVEGYTGYRILRGLTTTMCQHVEDETLDLLYIDANHSYEGVRDDLQAWWSKIKPGAICAGHDFLNTAYGVQQAVTEFCRDRGLEVHTITEDHISDAGFWFRKP